MLSSGEPLAYLVERRRLSVGVLKRYGVGWDADRGDLTFPTFADGEPVNLYRRKPVDGAKMIVSRARPRPPYPDLPPGAVCLVAGEIDALTGRMLGLKAVTVSGMNLPDAVIPRFAGRAVWVMFDVGEEDAAGRVAEKLRAAGSRAYIANLASLRLSEGGDLNDAWRAGIAAEDVKRLICRAQRSA